VILDEADAMTQDAQNALRRIMEKYTSITRFCLICNYMTKIIPALQSRCTRFRFAPLKPEQIIPRLDHIIREENLKCSPDAKTALISLADGDMRRVINTLQSTAMAFDKVITQDNVHKCCGQPTQEDIEGIFEELTDETKDVKDVCDYIHKLQQDKGLALQDLITRLHLKLLNCE
jgi:replication factor C subunit 3/5